MNSKGMLLETGCRLPIKGVVTFFRRLILLVKNLNGLGFVLFFVWFFVLLFVSLQDFSCVSPFISSTVISFAVIVKGNGLQVHGHDDDESLGHLPNDFTLNGKRKILWMKKIT